MKKVLFEYFEKEATFSGWRIVWLIEDNKNTWRIWSWNWEDILTRYVHKNSIGERVREL